MIAKDKLIHFSVCLAIALGMMVVFRVMSSPILFGVVASLSSSVFCGLGKEYGDMANPYNKWDWMDFLADCLGAIVGTLIGVFAFVI